MMRATLWLLWAVAAAVWPWPAAADVRVEAPAAAPAGYAAPAVVGWVRIDDAIQPASAGFLDRALRWAEREGCGCLVVELDTPGGLDTAMRRMIKGILASPVPVVVYVSPPGSRAASAGVFLMMAAHVAAMAPGTNLGAAHPVAIGGLPGTGGAGPDTTMLAKVTNDAVAYVRSLATQRGRNADWAERAVRESVSIPSDEALELGVIDLLAVSPEALLEALEGRPVEVAGETRALRTAAARLIHKRMDLRDQILGSIANPNIAYLLLLLGALGIFFELSHPGSIFPGVVGAVALFLAFFALQMLPVRAAGIALILLAIVLFVLEIKVTSYGALAMGGVAALLFGSLMLFDSGTGVRLALGVIVPSVVVVGALFIAIVALAARAQGRRTVTGAEGLVGRIGEARTALAPEGRVFVHGELWRARSRERVAAGERVRVVRVRGLELDVEPQRVLAEGADDTGR
ncbi:MAG: nodulation protein NfeD [Candidatus Eisenbacteria bacterium]|uniref:Nodulation protein NfeD n=1 Tax=Eiseniibacteriota bacterium TaxID=2212470 RepID=A0A937X709_UNCEI|nr:nodulation protein NfeD [Candidatus Eisenbacteria bacterium]